MREASNAPGVTNHQPAAAAPSSCAWARARCGRADAQAGAAVRRLRLTAGPQVAVDHSRGLRAPLTCGSRSQGLSTARASAGVMEPLSVACRRKGISRCSAWKPGQSTGEVAACRSSGCCCRVCCRPDRCRSRGCCSGGDGRGSEPMQAGYGAPYASARTQWSAASSRPSRSACTGVGPDGSTHSEAVPTPVQAQRPAVQARRSRGGVGRCRGLVADGRGPVRLRADVPAVSPRPAGAHASPRRRC